MSDDEIVLESPVLRVVLGDVEVRDSWELHLLQTIGRDRSRAEQLIAKHHWGKLDEGNLFRLQELMAYFALKRNRIIDDIPFDDFLDAYIEITVVDEEEADVVRPTRPGLDPGYL